jgi:hypothetical protein
MRKKLLLTLGGIFVGLLLGEAVARVILPLLPDPPNTPFIGDENCMYRLRPSEPGEFPEDHDDHVNTRGFRDRSHPLAKPAGRVRVLGLGDSFVYGAVSVRDNFLRVAQREVNQKAPVPTDILLMGVPGWSPENELGYLENAGLALDPDLVVVNFFVGNDVVGIPVRGRVIRGNVYPTTSPKPLRNLLRKSHLFVMLESLVLRRMMRQLKESPKAAPLAKEGPVPVSEGYLKIARQVLPVFLREPDPRTAALWDEAEGYLTRIEETCRAAGVPWLLVLIPDEIQVDAQVRSQVMDGLGVSIEEYDFDAPQKRLARWAAGQQVPVLDLLPGLRRKHRPDARLYAPNDTHWNERGNLTAGLMVGRAILELSPELN